MAQVIVRDSHPLDDFQIGELLVRAFVESYARELPDVVVTEERKRELRDVQARREQGARVLVAELQGRIVGSVTVYPPGASSSEAWLPCAADVRQLGIELSLRGAGISQALLDEAERIVRDEWRCDALCLHVRRGARGVAEMYLKRGFKRDEAGDMDRLPMIYLEAYSLVFNDKEMESGR